MLVLYEAGGAAWAGALRERKDTCTLLALSLNTTAKRQVLVVRLSCCRES